MDDMNDLILLKIFFYLPIKCLKTLMPTCKKWNELIKETIQIRKKPIQTILFKNDHLIESCPQNDFVNSNYFISEIDSELEKLLIQPKFGLFFINESFETHFNVTKHENKAKRKRFEGAAVSVEYLKKILNIPTGFLVSAPGVIGTDIQISQIVEIDDDLVDALSGIIFPESNYYRIVLKNIKNAKELRIEEFQSDTETVKYALIFSKSFLQINKVLI